MSTNILMVEYEHIIQAVHSCMILKLGYTLDIAEAGNEAITKANSKKYDIILMDLSLPCN